jgi:hypothetical protein
VKRASLAINTQAKLQHREEDLRQCVNEVAYRRVLALAVTPTLRMLAAGGTKMLNAMISGNQQVLGLGPAVGTRSSCWVIRQSADPAGQKDRPCRRFSFFEKLPIQPIPVI